MLDGEPLVFVFDEAMQLVSVQLLPAEIPKERASPLEFPVAVQSARVHPFPAWIPAWVSVFSEALQPIRMQLVPLMIPVL